MLKEIVQAQTCVLNRNTLDSREVSQMLGKEHWMVLRDIEGNENVTGIIPTLTDNKFVVSDYFIEDKYKDDSGKLNKCYLITKMGCELIGNKQQGAKGILFTAKYVKRFNQMEEVLKEQQPTCIEDVLIASLKEMKEVKNKLQEVETKQIETKEEIQGIRDIVEIKPRDTWRNDSNTILRKICSRLNDYKIPKEEVYKALEQRAGCNLKTRLNNLRGRAFENCWSQSKINNLNYLDVIEDDKKLIEIYLAIVKEMSIKYGI